jgi:putative addiction module CopG family antidote
MDVFLSPELENFCQQELQSGRYKSPDELVNRALSLLKRTGEAERRLEMLLQEAEESGPATEMTNEDWAEIERDGLLILKERSA